MGSISTSDKLSSNYNKTFRPNLTRTWRIRTIKSIWKKQDVCPSKKYTNSISSKVPTTVSISFGNISTWNMDYSSKLLKVRTQTSDAVQPKTKPSRKTDQRAILHELMNCDFHPFECTWQFMLNFFHLIIIVILRPVSVVFFLLLQFFSTSSTLSPHRIASHTHRPRTFAPLSCCSAGPRRCDRMAPRKTRTWCTFSGSIRRAIRTPATSPSWCCTFASRRSGHGTGCTGPSGCRGMGKVENKCVVMGNVYC